MRGHTPSSRRPKTIESDDVQVAFSDEVNRTCHQCEMEAQPRISGHLRLARLRSGTALGLGVGKGAQLLSVCFRVRAHPVYHTSGTATGGKMVPNTAASRPTNTFQNNYEDTWTTNWTRSACEVTPFLHSTVPDSIDHHYRNRSGYKTFSVREHTPSPAHRLPPPTLSSAACPPASIQRPDTTHSHNPPSHAARPQSAGAHSSRAHCSLDTSPGLPCRTDLRRFPTTLARQVVNQDVVVVLSQHHILRGDLPETIPHPYVLLHAPLHAHARPQRDHHPTAALRLPVKEVKSPVPSQPAGLGISYATRGAPTTTAGE